MKEKEFNIKSISWHEVADKIDDTIISQLLNDNIELTSYGSGLKNIYFKYICVQASNTNHKNEASFKNGDLEIALQLSYTHVFENDNNTVTGMMIRLFLVSIDLYEKMEIPDFDVKRFRDDVQELFKKEGLLS